MKIPLYKILYHFVQIKFKFGLIKVKWVGEGGQGERGSSSFKALCQLQMQPKLKVMTMKINSMTGKFQWFLSDPRAYVYENHKSGAGDNFLKKGILRKSQLTIKSSSLSESFTTLRGNATDGEAW